MQKKSVLVISVLLIGIFSASLVSAAWYDSLANIWKDIFNKNIVLSPVEGDNILFSNSAKCNDTDGGIYSGVYGVVNGRYKDFCKTKTVLVDYYCSNGKVANKKIRCGTGCSNGTCLNVQQTRTTAENTTPTITAPIAPAAQNSGSLCGVYRLDWKPVCEVTAGMGGVNAVYTSYVSWTCYDGSYKRLSYSCGLEPGKEDWQARAEEYCSGKCYSGRNNVCLSPSATCIDSENIRISVCEPGVLPGAGFGEGKISDKVKNYTLSCGTGCSNGKCINTDPFGFNTSSDGKSVIMEVPTNYGVLKMGIMYGDGSSFVGFGEGNGRELLLGTNGGQRVAIGGRGYIIETFETGKSVGKLLPPAQDGSPVVITFGISSNGKVQIMNKITGEVICSNLDVLNPSCSVYGYKVIIKKIDKQNNLVSFATNMIVNEILSADGNYKLMLGTFLGVPYLSGLYNNEAWILVRKKARGTYYVSAKYRIYWENGNIQIEKVETHVDSDYGANPEFAGFTTFGQYDDADYSLGYEGLHIDSCGGLGTMNEPIYAQTGVSGRATVQELYLDDGTSYKGDKVNSIQYSLIPPC